MTWGACGMAGMMGMMFSVVLFGLVLLAAIGVGVWLVIRHRRPTSGDSALEILRDRYARGEISHEEFESRRRDLVA
jgi:putative membrane protein